MDMTIKLYGKETKLKFIKGTYANNDSFAVEIMAQDEETIKYYGSDDVYEPYCSLTVNLVESSFFEDDKRNRAYVDSNGCPVAIINMLIDNGLIIPTYSTANSGFCTYMCYIFTDEFLEQMEEME